MKKYNFKYFLPVVLTSLVLFVACKKSYLDVPPTGSLSPDLLANKIGVAGLLVGAYSLLDGEGSGAGTGNGPWATSSSNWVYASVAGGDAHKGSDPGDQNLITPIEQWNCLPSNGYIDQLWQQRYDGVQRANDVLRIMRKAKDLTPADTLELTAEARFLRAHYHFELRKAFGKIPWVSEDQSYSAGNFLTPNLEVLPLIEADLVFAYANLPEIQAQSNRCNKWAAACYLAKIYMFEKKFNEAKALFTTIVANGQTARGQKYALNAHFADNFNPALKNSKESVFAVQMSVNDGTNGANANQGDALNFPYGGGAQTSCCGFFQPSYSLANSYKVDANGLPMLDGSYNNTDLKNDQGIATNDAFTPDATTPVDPRIDWTIGRRGIPFLDWGIMPGQNWIRDQQSAGPYEGMKHMFYKSQIGTYTDASAWSNGFTANNYNLIRYADVLLLAAEAEAEVGSLDQATIYVNLVRKRAQDPTGFVQGSPARYVIGLYPTFASQDLARTAIRFERKLELAMEGHRFYDITRWGIGATELNAYQAHELSSNYKTLTGASYKTGRSEYLPIPQNQIDLSQVGGKSVLTQNPGY
ncbi:RagB/SusD family nutrient uptake outer membrane protein [Ferruginibacter sp.]|uniref:RagB/SusD family nutrient uptake outer membrane protein n=1 Tax=Ferruginibacter sp. TaxID=1940288 RepID=UPI0026595312|nr:RagB/SusD family nutrient uptake outer membrane protein [Ferruginibacter sp.]